MKRNILLNPGPATTSDTVKYAQVVPDICPREKEFGDLMENVSRELSRIVGGNEEYTAVLFGGSGTSVMDAAIQSTIPEGKAILIINNGAYGERMVQIAEAYRIPCVELHFEWDELPNLARIEKVLLENETIHAIAMVHHETTSGLLNPLKEVGELAYRYNKRFIVDVISSYAGIPIDVKECHIDFALASSNKCIQGMAGIGFIICRNEALMECKSIPRRSYYLSLYDQWEYFIKNHQMRFTPPVQTLYALQQAIKEYHAEGGTARYQRYTQNWEVLRQGIIDSGYTIMTKSEQESHLLITIDYNDHPDFDFDKVHDALYDRGFTIYPGKIGKKNTFRIATIGDIYPEDIRSFLTAFREVTAGM